MLNIPNITGKKIREITSILFDLVGIFLSHFLHQFCPPTNEVAWTGFIDEIPDWNIPIPENVDAAAAPVVGGPLDGIGGGPFAFRWFPGCGAPVPGPKSGLIGPGIIGANDEPLLPRGRITVFYYKEKEEKRKIIVASSLIINLQIRVRKKN